MQKKLVIVESPAKAKTIEKFLGKDYQVLSSYGHIRDLKAKEFSVDIEHDYTPQYVIPADKRKVVAELKKASAGAEEVLLASDEDREGEAIAWHLAETLGLEPEKTQRIVFHEITKNAILHALNHPRSININLVNAQQARRVLDRMVGFEVSPILWRKVKPALSAGRVQSVAVRLLVEREREIQQFVSEASYRVTAHFLLSDGQTLLKTELNRRLKNREEARDFLQFCRTAEFVVDDISTKPFRKSPPPPFTTSTLQQEAARKLGFSVSQTMIVAQRLYESGCITYMRTDSLNLSDLALGASRETITGTYGEKYYRFRKYQTKSKGAQEAHEAIRPTDMSAPEIHGSVQDKKLYDLIYKRTLACQMADAELERTTITIGIGGKKEKFTATGEVIQFDGFLHVYMESVDEDAEKEQENGLLPPVALNETPGLSEMTAVERFTQRPPRYTEATLVRRLEELGIGRPSTYAPTIQTIQNREYVVRGDRPGKERTYGILALKDGQITSADKTEVVGADRNKLLPTDIGIVVNDFLVDYFPDVMDYNFTASVEKEFDAIAEGELAWTRALDKFYKFFHPIVEATSAVKTVHKVGERQVGIDPQSGEPVFVKIGRYGPIAQIGQGSPDNKDAPKPRFASLMKGQSIETITLEETLKLFDLPRSAGEFEGDEITVGLGRFGPYIRFRDKFISIPKTLNPHTISDEEAIRLIREKRAREAERIIKQFEEEPGLEVLNGRYGAYIACQGVNYRIPKDMKPDELTLEACRKIIELSPTKTGKSRKTGKRNEKGAVSK
ncbi:MAG: type I DNA topoisomerase [Tannerella sp.]|jgi:DNA topoisomerase-1|nr:type I DNA topoisomerase [Tannerella sp.]